MGRTHCSTDPEYRTCGESPAGPALSTRRISHGLIFHAAGHVAQIPNGEDERDDPKAVEYVRERGQRVGRRRGDGRDERLRALDGLGFHGLLRVDESRSAVARAPREPQGEVAGIFFCVVTRAQLDAASEFSRP